MEMDIDLEGKSGELYEVVWNGLKKISKNGRLVETYDDVSNKPYPDGSLVTLSYKTFWWDHAIPWWFESYGCTVLRGALGLGKCS